MLKKIALALGLAVLCMSCDTGQKTTNKLSVVTTLFPTYDFARQVGKDKVDVTFLLPPGVEPHSYTPTPKDIVTIKNADVFVYTGENMELWAKDIVEGIENKKLAVVDSSTGIELIDAAEHESDEHHDDHGHEKAHKDGHHDEHDHAKAHKDEHHDDHDHAKAHKDEHHDHHHGDKDPHIWLDLGHAQKMVDTITLAFIEKDPENKEFYLKNASGYKKQLADLDQRFQKALSTAKHKSIIYGGHYAFAYFANRYGLTHESPYEGFSPNAEPSPKSIASLIKSLRASGQKYIFHEDLVDAKVARIISEETGAKLEVLHPAPNLRKDELKSGKTFIDVMEQNLNVLKKGLESR